MTRTLPAILALLAGLTVACGVDTSVSALDAALARGVDSTSTDDTDSGSGCEDDDEYDENDMDDDDDMDDNEQLCAPAPPPLYSQP